MSLKQSFLKLKEWLTRLGNKLKPGNHSIKGAAYGLLIGSILFFVIEVLGMAMNFKDPWIMALGILVILASLLFTYLGNWLIAKFYQIPKAFKIALLFSIPVLLLVRLGDPRIMVFLMIVFSLLGAGFAVVRASHFKNLTLPKKSIAVLGLLLGLAGIGTFVYFLGIRGLDMRPLINAAKLAEDKITPIDLESPANPGPFEVEFFTYGSGEDKQREEYAAGVKFKTASVDGTAFLDQWEGISGKYRTRAWGFDFKALPINGRVWKPKGKGPFPLVLIVHGNHPMQDYSDPGYEYLGNLLASRGFILVSVDENFLNGSWSDFPKGLEKENDARGWILLEHLRQWKDWNQDPTHDLFGQVAMDKLALIGHSRGGEAVGHAAMLNQLDFYPDDATIPLGYHFDIQSIIAIAPVDGQYKPGSSLTKFKNVSYLSIHGAQDQDVESFDGAKQYERISFSDSIYRFKTGVYIGNANHGQFNSGWGDNDMLATFSGVLNRGQLMDPKDQETIAKVYISAFLETTLHRNLSYLPLFADARKGRNWLPETIYLSQFEDSKSKFWAGYDEDFDVLTLSDGGKAQGLNLSLWREGEVLPKYGLKGTRAVFLGWNYEEFGKDSLDWEATTKPNLPDSVRASYTLTLGPDSFRPDSSSVLIFSLAESDESSNPKSSGKWIKNKNDNKPENPEKNDSDKEKSKDDEKKDDKALIPLDFTLELRDDQGERISFLLSEYSPLQRLIKTRVMKIQFLDKKDETESIFQFYQFDLGKLTSQNPNFQVEKLRQIQFIFDQSEAGVVVLDQVGLMPKFPK
ncbi:poly(ethylene terephthalate) hydrolase family protein [Algoriphagus mannitolivorans]|uniref:poly(ethylene terephthalate) hydrolase family protein n=1 Tax=Algoriphagus mannitolivorans TaxID=226504 RepID=UPI000415F30A|nr:hypothetical protein [Algoriphagus mannitolivorans]